MILKSDRRIEAILAAGLLVVFLGMASCSLEPKKAANTSSVTLKLSSAASAKLAALAAATNTTPSSSQTPVPYAPYELRYVFFPEGKYSFAAGTFPPFLNHGAPPPIDDAHFPVDEHGVVTGEVSRDDTTFVYQFVLDGILPRKQTMCMIQIYDPRLTSYYYSSGGTFLYDQLDTAFVVTLGTVSGPFDLNAGQTVVLNVDLWY
jgi:hypothetical protein